MARPGRLLVVSDFDGTLAEGSRDPGATRIVPACARSPCAAWPGSPRRGPDRLAVAVLTGRTVADVAARVRVGGIQYLGDHGLQNGTLSPPGPRRTPDRHVPARPRSGAGAGGAPGGARARDPRAPDRGCSSNAKGPSVAFHVRQAEDRVAARAAVVAAIETVDRELPEHDLAHYRGRLVVDLRPRAAGGKREAIERLLAELRTRRRSLLRRRQQRRRRVRRAPGGARCAAAIDGLAIGVTGPHGMPDDVRATADVVARHAVRGRPDARGSIARSVPAKAAAQRPEPRRRS